MVFEVRSAIASLNSDARSRPKVKSKIELGSCPSLILEIADWINTVVFPEPGPPLMINGLPRCAIATCCADDN